MGRGDRSPENKLMVGLEIHFQLKGKKLFCDCATESYGMRGETFERRLSPTASEMGLYDPAAEYEKRRGRSFVYVPTDNSCLVEADEEPPHAPNSESIETGLMVANALNCRKVDSVMFMRKVVVDGSNTSGFQRTAIIGFDGEISTSRGTVRISTVCVEEDSARRLEGEEKGSGNVVYSLDRLGIPLLEIATEPDIVNAEHAVEVARKIGYVVASTGKSRRQVDSIRQDVNISLGFGRVEIKGIQKLSLIGDSIAHEMNRQNNMSRAVSEFLKRGGLTKPVKFIEAVGPFDGTDSKILKNAFKAGKSLYCSVLANMDGLLKKGDFRIGRDLSDIAKAFGLGGIMHTDELPAFGITENELSGLKGMMCPGRNDALLLVIAERDKTEVLSNAISDRVAKLSALDFSETRGPLEDGSTKFLRPLPGKERMYPETDVPIVRIGEDMVRSVESFVPRSEDEMATDLSRNYSISLQDAKTIASNLIVDDLEAYASTLGDGKLAARILLQTVPEIEKRHGKSFEKDELSRLFAISYEKKWPRSVLEAAMEIMLEEGKSAGESAKKLEERSMNREELKSIVEEILRERGPEVRTGSLIALIKQKTQKSFDPKEAIQIFNEL